MLLPHDGLNGDSSKYPLDINSEIYLSYCEIKCIVASYWEVIDSFKALICFENHPKDGELLEYVSILQSDIQSRN